VADYGVRLEDFFLLKFEDGCPRFRTRDSVDLQLLVAFEMNVEQPL
jgi:hypothetical protein